MTPLKHISAPLELADHVHARWMVDLNAAGAPDVMNFNDLLKPTTWAGAEKRWKPGDIVRVVGGPENLDVDLLVVAVGMLGAVVRYRPPGGIVPPDREAAA